MDKPHDIPPFEFGKKVTKTVEVFDKMLFKPGTPVAMHTYTSGLVKMYWDTEYGIVKENTGEKLTITTMKITNGVGVEFDTNIHSGYAADDDFHIIPLDKLIEDLQEELHAK